MRQGKAPAMHDDDAEELRLKISISLGLFFVSLFAVSFPSITKRVKALRVPPIVFFLGKHFGTGVILSTAFVHLLPDAFGKYRSRWTGFVVLGSLLSIFLVEYVTTAYVDHLHSYSSAPPTPSSSPSPSPSRSPSRTHKARIPRGAHKHDHDHDHSDADASDDGSSGFGVDICERTPLLLASSTPPTTLPVEIVDADVDYNEPGRLTLHTGTAAVPLPLSVPVVDLTSPPHHHNHSYTNHEHPHPHSHARPQPSNSEEELEQTEEAIFAGAHHRYEARGSHVGHSWGKCGGKKVAAVVVYHAEDCEPDEGREATVESGSERRDVNRKGRAKAKSKKAGHGRHRHSRSHDHSHSHAHGQGLGHTHGGHTHLDMSSWDPDVEACSSADAGEEEEEQVRVGRRRQIVGILMLQIGIMLHSLVIGLTLSVSTGSEFTSLVTAILFHQLFEGLSLGIRIAGLPSERPRATDAPRSTLSRALKPLLALTFGLTTPLGIWVGLGLFGASSPTGGKSPLGETQSLLSALSAGMLIYAACVEMLAADFVMDQTMWRAPMRRQVIALLAVAVGVAGMSMVG